MEGWEGQGQSLDTESFDSGVKGTAVKATGTSGQGWVGGGWACGRQGARDVVETDRVHVYCPAEVLQQEGGWGRRRQRRRKQFIWSTRNSWGGRPTLPLSKAKCDVRKGCPVPKRPVSCLPPRTSVPLSLPRAEPVGQPFPRLVLRLGPPFPVGSPTELQDYLLLSIW